MRNSTKSKALLFKDAIWQSPVVAEIRETYNYDLFSIMKGNRLMNDLHLKRLKKSVQSKALTTIIVVNEQGVIIDGQHRFCVLKELGLPIKYLICEGYGMEEVHILNTNSVSWNQMDFLNGYCQEGFDEYLKLRTFMELYPDFKIQASRVFLTQLLTGRKQGTIEGVKVGNNQDFEKGEFVVVDLEKAYEMADKHMMFKQYFGNHFAEAIFVRSMVKIYLNKNYDHQSMMRRVAKYPEDLVTCKNVEQYRLMIEKIYNRGRDKKVNLRY